MKKIIILSTAAICAVLLLFFLGKKPDQPAENDPSIVAEELREKYNADFIYLSSLTDEDGSTKYQYCLGDNKKLVVEAFYHYAHDPLFIFPFYKRAVFQDNMAESIRDFCILATFGSYDVHVPESPHNYERLSGEILECMDLIEKTFSNYNIDKNLNGIYISINLIYDGRTVESEFTPRPREEITSQIMDALRKMGLPPTDAQSASLCN